MSDPKRLFIIHGDKGGVGKSLFARVLVHYLTTRKIACDYYDCDETDDLYRFYPEIVSRCDFSKVSDIAPVLDRLMDGKGAPAALMDLAGGHGSELVDWLIRSRALEAAAEGDLKIVVFYLLGNTMSSINLLSTAYENLGDKVSWGIVKNLHFAPEFVSFDQTARLRPALIAGGAIEIQMPELDKEIGTIIDRDELSFDKARKQLPFTPRGYLRTWLDGVCGQLEEHGARLGLGSAPAPAPAG